jgi:5-methylcytosine-specific restriction endonuclease McrA
MGVMGQPPETMGEPAEEAQPGLLVEVVDHVLPILPPYELSIYLYLLRRSRLLGRATVRVGKRTIGEDLGKGTRSRQGNYQHISDKLNNLARDGFIAIGDTDRHGTLYSVALPEEVPSVRERMAVTEVERPPNFFRDPELRQQLFERDGWLCRYCGTSVSADTATLDHMMPVSGGGTDDPSNLATACLMCNSIKSGRSYEQAAPDILDALRRNRRK